jgi:toxin ParE1/3/4
MAHRVVFSPLAEADLNQIVDYIAQDNAGAAHRFGQQLLAQNQALARTPFLGVAAKGRRSVRFIVYYPYQIFYRVNDDAQTVEVLRFWHGAQSPSKLRLG